MSDSLKPGINVLVSFVDGESPSPAKLNSITAQMKNAATNLEKAVGDIHNDSYPYTTSSTTSLNTKWGTKRTSNNPLSNAGYRFLDVANLGRITGPASSMNPRMLGGTSTITEDIPVGVHEFALRLPISGTVSITNPSFADTALRTLAPSAVGLLSSGDYYVEPNGRVWCIDATEGGTATYTTNPNKYAGGMNHSNASFNVIPDPNQIEAGGNGVSIGALDGQGRYPVSLPLITHQQSNIGGDSVELDENDPNYHKQLTLPGVLSNNLSAGDVIPDGFLYLKDETTKKVYTDAIYYFDSSTAILVGNLSLTDEIGAGHTFSIITIGNDIATSIDDLRLKTFHTHDRTFGEPYVTIDNVALINKEAGASGVFVRSQIPGNFAPQYLHRDGFRSLADINANDNNAMRGDILLGLFGGGAGTYVGNSGTTFKLRFGNNTSSNPYIFRNSSNELELHHPSNNVVVKSSADVVLEPDQNIILTPGTSGYVQATKELHVIDGMSGGLPGSDQVAPYFTTGTQVFDMDGSAEELTLDVLITGPTRQWRDVRVWLSPNGLEWVQPSRDHDDHSFQAGWEEDGGGSTLYIVFYTADSGWALLSPPASVYYRVTIWYVTS